MRICWAQYALWAVVIGLAVLTLLAGCGAKGDLYLPKQERPAHQAPAAEKSAPITDAHSPAEQ